MRVGCDIRAHDEQDPLSPSGDAIVHQRVHDAIDAEEMLSDSSIEASVTDGVALLRGEVGTETQRSRAEAVVSEVEGVTGIQNEIRIRQ
jgi:osmotically-inducible protein OsmY